MTIKLIIIAVILLLGLIFIPFFRQLYIDKCELKKQPLKEMFATLIETINQELFNGNADLKTFDDDPRIANMMDDDRPNLIVRYYYSTGNMSVSLGYKYFQKELKFTKQFHMRGSDDNYQRNCGRAFVEEALKKMKAHERLVLSATGYVSGTQTSEPTINTGYDEVDPMSVVNSLFADFTLSQRQSILNLMYEIGRSDGTSDSTVKARMPFMQAQSQLQVSWLECKKQYEATGRTDGIISDLKALDDSKLDTVIIHVFPMALEDDGNPNEIRFSEMFSLFEAMGRSPENVMGVIKKMMLLMQHFGM